MATTSDAPVPMLAVAALSFAAFAGAASTRVADPLLPRLDAEFGIGLGAAAQVVTAFSIAYGLLQLFYGPLGDRFGKYRVVAWTCAASAVTASLCALAPDFPALTIARFLAGSTAAAVIPLSMAWIGDVVPYERRQGTLARFLMGQIFGSAGGPLMGGLAAQYWSWRVPFVVLAIWFSVAAVMLFRINRRLGEERTIVRAPGQSVARRLFGDFAYVLGQGWARVVLVTAFLEGAAMFGAFAFIPSHLHIAYGLSLAVAGSCLILFGVGGLSFASMAPVMVRRLGEAGLAAGGGVVLCIALLLVALASSLPFALLACFLAGFGFYMLHNTLQTNATQMAPERRGGAVAMFASSLFMGQAVGVAVAGSWVERLSTKPIIIIGACSLLVIGFGFSRLRSLRPPKPGYTA